MNWKTCFLPLLLAAVMLGSVTAFADGEPVTPETTEPTEMETRETEGSWNNNIYTDNQGIVYQLNDDGQTVTLTDGSRAIGSITIPATIEKDGTIYPVTSVGGNAFARCWWLVSVTFSDNIDSIGDNAFQYCTALNTVTFFGGVGSIGDSAFVNCVALKTLTFSGNVGSIEYGAFGNCTALESVTFSSSVTSVGDSAFANCTALENVTFSGDVRSIGIFAFYSCDALENVTFSGDVGSIEDWAFDSCTALESVTFSGDVGSIGNFAFWGCTALKTIYVPSMSDEKNKIIRDALTGSGLQNVQIVQPEQPSDPDPDTPPDPSTGTPSTPSTGTTSTGSAVQQLEAAERPDPMDVEATERYNFWMDVKSDLRAAGDGRTVRVYVPADYTNMPASVMETIRTLGKEITIDLRWNGQRLIITPQTALKRPARKAFWTLSQLCEEYAR